MIMTLVTAVWRASACKHSRREGIDSRSRTATRLLNLKVSKHLHNLTCTLTHPLSTIPEVPAILAAPLSPPPPPPSPLSEAYRAGKCRRRT